MGENREPTIAEVLWAKTMGQEALTFIQSRNGDIGPKIHSEALALLEQIKTVLDDDSLDDPTCFQHIDAIVDAFFEAGIDTSRHNW